MATQMTGECNFGMHADCPKASYHEIGGPDGVQMSLPCKCSCHDDPYIGHCWTCGESRLKSQCHLMETPTGDYHTCNTCLMPVDESVLPF